jgi:putative ABC transport system permease protein
MPYVPPMRSSLAVGLDALRANPLRTILSTLGVVMGVGAMVSVLALGDGVEKYAREQIEKTTDFLSVSIRAEEFREVDGINVRIDSVIRFRSADARAAASALGATKVAMLTTGTALAVVEGSADPRGFSLVGMLPEQLTERDRRLLAGTAFTDSDTGVVVLGARAASVVSSDSARPELALGRSLMLNGHLMRVVGVIAPSGDERGLQAAMPVDDAYRVIGPNRAPVLTLTAALVEDVPRIEERAKEWLVQRFGASAGQRTRVATNAARVEQMMTGLLIFKLLMTAITGVSLLVGGIGIMNVLLASVVERTREIGIRKATGAKNRDILVQFLGESVAITSAGAAVGVALGLAIAYGAAAVMRARTEAPVHAAVTLQTILFAAAASVTIGIAFGLYPALRAARLSPIDAIRHE